MNNNNTTHTTHLFNFPRRKMAKHDLLFSVLLLLVLELSLVFVLAAQDQSGFISVDCGYLDKPFYKDGKTQINYTSDANLIDTGVNSSISAEYKANSSFDQQFWNVRSFPFGARNCYSFNDITRDNSSLQYLVRARFMYGNYDAKNFLPKFEIHLGTIKWDTVEFQNPYSVVTKEIIYSPVLYYVHVCLFNIGKGTPFISVLEIRPIHGYDNDQKSSELIARFDLGSQDGKAVRYPDDVYDRIWTPYGYGYGSGELKNMSTSLPINEERFASSLSISTPPAPPYIVMRTAAYPANANDNLTIPIPARYNGSTISNLFYVAELQKLPPNQSRELHCFAGGDSFYTPFNTSFLLGMYDGAKRAPVDVPRAWISTPDGSTLPPIANAFEIFAVRDVPRSETDRQDTEAIMKIKKTYEIKKNWQGDPCYPPRYIWEGINCTGEGSGRFKITSLNLSSSGITDLVYDYIFKLKSLEHLDLSNNRLTGEVPGFLSDMQSLTFLNIKGNELSGEIPAELIEKSNNGSLTFLWYPGNPNLCIPGSCKKRNQKKVVIPVAASLAGAFIAAITFYILKRRQLVSTTPSMRPFLLNIKKRPGSNNQQFTYAEIIAITNNFDRVLGKGAFGTVYHGYVGNIQVAVKMLSPSTQGYKQFEAEANLLTRVHHKSLTALLGYCNEGTNAALIYEYMENGDLSEYLSDKSEKFLSWKQRIQIAVDAAKGLEYLHNGCKPPIVHRDIKSRNILLNDKLRGRIGDFGLSKIFPDDGDTHVFTIIAGTPGYVDPQYCVTNRLNEKSDVYSFGVVLLELITGQPAITKTEGKTHITQWVGSMLLEREIDDIMDPRLQGTFDPNSVKQALDTAMACVAPTSTNRPTMREVVMELKQCLALQMAQESDSVVGSTPNNLTEPSSALSTSNRLNDFSFGSFSGESSLIR